MKVKDGEFILKDEYDFSKGIRGRFYTPKKKSTTIRLDNDVILYFKKKASQEKVGYQTLMNSALREFINNHKVDLKASNGETIAVSEGYSSEDSCLNGIESVKKNTKIAKLEDQTEEKIVSVTNPKFEMYIDKAGGYRFRLKARNGEIIAAEDLLKISI